VAEFKKLSELPVSRAVNIGDANEVPSFSDFFYFGHSQKNHSAIVSYCTAPYFYLIDRTAVEECSCLRLERT